MSDPVASERPRSSAGCLLALVLIVLIIAGTVVYLYERMESWPQRAAQQVRSVFGELAHLQPRVSVRDRVFFEQAADVLELAVVSRQTQVEHESEQEWLRSKKRIKLRGVYRVRAGFDLTQPFSVRVEDDRRLRVEVPPAKILSVEQVDMEVLAYEHGLWNKIQPAELEAELRQLPLLARSKASEAGMQKEAVEMFARQLREKFAGQFEVDVQVTRPAVTPQPRRD
jgi:hypothetical protein